MNNQFSQCPSCYVAMQRRGTRNGKTRYWCPNCNKWRTTAAVVVNRTARVLLFDIETLPMVLYGWDLFRPVFSHENIIKDGCTLSWAGKWLFDSETFGDILTPKEAIDRDDSRIVKSLWKKLDEADIVIFHNGVKFDNRKMNTRFLYHGLPPPSPYQMIDTKIAAKKMFYFPSNSQAYITTFLQLQEKLETDFNLWKRCDGGEKMALSEMFEYNKQDIAGLEEMYVTLRPWIPQHPNLSVYLTTEEAHCPKCQSKEITLGGIYATPANLYRGFRCNSCGTIGRSSNSALTTQKRKNMVRVP
jgi:transposase-like protein